MPGMLNQILAREHLHELLRQAEEERRGAAPRSDSHRARALLRRLRVRRRNGPEPRGAAATIVECPHDW